MDDERNNLIKKFKELPVEEQVKVVESITACLEPLISKTKDMVNYVADIMGQLGKELREQHPELFTKSDEAKG